MSDPVKDFQDQMYMQAQMRPEDGFGFGPGTPQYSAYRQMVDLGKALYEQSEPAYMGNHPFSMGGAGWAALVNMGGIAAGGGLAGSAGGASSGLTGVNYSGTYLPQVASSGAAVGGAAGTAGSASAAAGGGGGGGLFSSLFGGGGASAGAGGGMGASNWMNLAGMLFGGLGSKYQADAQTNASNRAADAAAYRPYNYSSAGGGSVFGPGNQVSSGFSPGQQGNYDLMGQNAQNYLGGNTPNSQFLNFSQGLGNNQIPQLFNQFLSANQQVPTDAYSSFLNQNQSLGNQSQNLFSSLLGGAQGAQGMGMNTLQGVLGQAQGGPNFGQSNGLLGMAGQAAMGASHDMSGMVNDRLSLLRQQAAPQEAQQLQSTRDSLFGQGRLGAGDNTIGGANPEMQALYNSFGQNDLGRQVQAQNLGMQAQQQLFGQGMGQAGALQGLAGQSAYNSNNAYQGLLGLGSLGGQTLNQGFGQMGNLGNLLNQSGNFNSQGLNASQSFSDLLNSRAGQAMQGAQGLFGFGNDMNMQNMTTGLNMQTGQNNLQSMLNSLAQMGGTFGTQNAGAGANQAQAYLQNNGSPMGGFLSGLGAGMFNPNGQQRPGGTLPALQQTSGGQTPNWMPGPNGTLPIWGD